MRPIFLQGFIFQSPYGGHPRSRICRDFKWLLFGFSEAYFHFMRSLHEIKASLAKTRKVPFKITQNPAPRGVPVWRLENRALQSGRGALDISGRCEEAL